MSLWTWTLYVPPAEAGEAAAEAHAAAEAEAEQAAAEKVEEEAAMAAAFGPLGSAFAAAAAAAAEAVAGGAAGGSALAGGSGPESVGGAGGLSFEEYVVLRGLVESSSLEEQFRFLWRVLDRDGDGHLSREDLRSALRLQAARLGWDEAGLRRWVDWAHDATRRERDGGRGRVGTARASEQRIGPAELKAALVRSAQLRTVLMACEPAAGLLSRQPTYKQAADGGVGGMPAWLSSLARQAGS